MSFVLSRNDSAECFCSGWLTRVKSLIIASDWIISLVKVGYYHFYVFNTTLVSGTREMLTYNGICVRTCFVARWNMRKTEINFCTKININYSTDKYQGIAYPCMHLERMKKLKPVIASERLPGGYAINKAYNNLCRIWKAIKIRN